MDMSVGGCDSYAMVGQAYMNQNFSEKFREYMEDEINDFGRILSETYKRSDIFYERVFGKCNFGI